MSRISNLVNSYTTKKQFVKKDSNNDAVDNVVTLISQAADFVEDIANFLTESNQDKKCNAKSSNDNCNNNKCTCYKYTEPNKNDYCKDFSPIDNDKDEYVNHPGHYQGHKFEAIDIIEDFELGFNLGNALKYLLRCNKKWNKEEDLKKAIWYLNRELSSCKKS